MRAKSLAVAAVVGLLTAGLLSPAESAQRQRSPGGESRGGGGNGGNGGGGGGGQRQAAGGSGGQQANAGGAQRQPNERSAQRRDGGSRRESGGQAESGPPPQSRQASGVRQQPDSRTQSQNRRQAAVRQPSPRATTLAPQDVREREARADEQRVARERWSNNIAGSGGGAQPRVAVPRPGPAPRDGRYYDRNWHKNGYRVYAPYGGYKYYYNRYPQPYYYYPYAFGYGPYGRGYFYFDLHYNSHVFYPHTALRYDNYGTYYGTYGYPTGELRIQVRPRDAQVFIDGAYAGTVDDFDGTFQSLRLEEGEYQVEIVLPGFEPLTFDVQITPGEKVTYKGDLIPEQP